MEKNTGQSRATESEVLNSGIVPHSVVFAKRGGILFSGDAQSCESRASPACIAEQHSAPELPMEGVVLVVVSKE